MIKLPNSLKIYQWDRIIKANVKIALAEDLNSAENTLDGGIDGNNHYCIDANLDITGLLIPKESQIEAHLLLRDPAVIAGIDWFSESFKQINDNIKICWNINEGELLPANKVIAKIYGPARAILTAERTAMNFLQTLSATATQTYQLTELIKHTNCKLLDTRKTLPGLRLGQKYAVVCGGGENHRIGLNDRFLIKENHIFTCGTIEKAIFAAKKLRQQQSLQAKIEIEVENMDELSQALSAGADIIMLDNFTAKQTEQAVTYKNQQNLKIKLESSGNIHANTIISYAETGVDYVSVGAITKSIMAVDLSLRVKN